MIKANFSAYNTYVTDSLYQWSLNQVLSINGLNLSIAPEVHFSNANMDKAIVRQSTLKDHVVSVAIPNSLLQEPLPVKAHIGVYEGDTFKVIEMVEIPVIARKRPDDYSLSEDDAEIWSFKRLDNKIAQLVDMKRYTYDDEELLDIRTDVDGKRHTTAGNAIRAQITTLAKDIEVLNRGGLSLKEDFIGAQVESWLDDHPEATTTVQDKSLTIDKMVIGALGYVTPEMFGAVGDGFTVDNNALNECFAYCSEHGIPCYGENRTYLVDDSTVSIAEHFGVFAPGGIYIRDFTFKLKNGCGDKTVLLSCLYNDNDYVIENCVFIGELRSISSGTEDGGNHGLLFSANDTLFPANWQTYGNISVKNCKFYNIQSYGIFPTPVDGKLIVENCHFECCGPAILSYFTNTFISKCDYVDLPSETTTAKYLAIDEIENFSECDPIPKNIKIIDCTSTNGIYNITENTQRGVIYGDILIDNCKCSADVVHTFDLNGDFSIISNSVIIRDCYSSMDVGKDNANGLFLTSLHCDVTIDNLKCSDLAHIRISSDANVTIKNTDINFPILVYSSAIANFNVLNCNFKKLNDDYWLSYGYISIRYGASATIDVLNIIGCTSYNGSMIVWGVECGVIHVNGLIGVNTPIQLLYSGSEGTYPTNVYVEGLCMPKENEAWSYFIQNIAGIIVLNGIAKGLALAGCSNVSNNLVVIE